MPATVIIDPLLNDGYENAPIAGIGFGFSVAYLQVLDQPTTQGGLLVGAPYFDNGSFADAGKIFLYSTQGGALPTSPTWSYAGTQSGGQLGWSVGDAGRQGAGGGRYGFHAIIVGAPGYYSGQGAAFAFYPDFSGIFGSSPDWSVYGGQGGAKLGWSVAGAKDINGDGFQDVVVGAPYYACGGTMTYSGLIRAYYGGTSGLQTSPGWSVCNESQEYLGTSVALGDVNYDHISDIIVGAPNAYSGKGVVYLYLGHYPNPDGTVSATLYGEHNGDNFGTSVASGADQNADTYHDVLVGAPGASFNSLAGAGKIYLYRGTSAGINNTAAWSDGGSQAYEALGTSLALGDMNLDGYAEPIVGGPKYSWTSQGTTEGGEVRVYLTSSGNPNVISFNNVDRGLCSYIHLGASVAYGYPLVNGHANFIGGAPGANPATCPSVDVMRYSP